MNYYERHLGDYARDTGHLSLLEHGVYNVLLDRIYSTESGIPDAQKYRLARARTEEERQAVDVVLDEFFSLSEGVWVNQRAKDEIRKASARIISAIENGKRGGRPKKPKPSETETQAKPKPFETETQEKPKPSETETQAKAHQTPDTRHQTPDKNPGVKHTVSESETTVRNPPPESVCSPPPSVTSGGLACKAIRQSGVYDGNPTHPTLLALLEAGATVEEFRQAAVESVAKGKPSFAYVVGIVKRRREEAAKLVLHQGRMPNKQEALEKSNRAVGDEWVRKMEQKMKTETDINGESEVIHAG